MLSLSGTPDPRNKYTEFPTCECLFCDFLSYCISLFVLQLISHCFKDQSSIINLDIWKDKMSPSLFLFFKIFLITFGLLFFHRHMIKILQNLLHQRKKKKAGIINKSTLNLDTSFGEIEKICNSIFNYVFAFCLYLYHQNKTVHKWRTC